MENLETNQLKEVETKEIHEKMRKHFKPLNDYILIEFVENLKTSGGIYLPPSSEETKAIAHPIIAVADSVGNKVKPGDWVSLRAMNLDIFKMYGRKFALIKDFDIMLVVDMGYILDEAQFKQAVKDNAKTFLN